MKPSRIPFCVGIMLLAACSPPKRAVPEEGNRVAERVEQAASLHTSITSLTPWDDIKESLKPAFKLDAADALTKSIPTTLVRLDRALDLLRFQLALTPTIVKQSGITTTTGGTGKETSTTEESKKETQSPDLPNVAPPSGLTSPTTSIQTAPDSPADSALQYQAAANLLRDVAVLNAEIENVARRTGHDAFLARFQVSVMPLSRGLGYDVYGNISVFAADGSFDPNTGKRTAGKMLGVAPLIVPILTTDSLQATRRTNSSTAKREIGLALNLLRSAGSVGATYGRDQENENEAAGADLESVVTVGRLSDNTVRIRLGADPMPGGGYGMVPRTFNISALVFVPKSANQLYYVSRLSLHNVLTGEELSTQRIPSYDEEIDSIVRRSKLDFPSLTAKVLKNPLDDYVFHGEFEEFEKFLTTFLPSGTTPYEKRREILYMWSQLTALNRKSRMANSLVDIPRPPPMQCPSNPLVIYSADDKAISVSLAGGKDFNVNQLKRSVLHVQSTCAQADTQQGARKSTGASAPKMTGRAAAEIKPPPQAVSCDIKKPPLSYPIPALSAETAKDGTSVALKFPPIAKLELTALPLSTQLKPESLGVFGCGGNLGTEQRYTGLALVSVKEEKDDSDAKKVALVPDSRVIIASKEGKGRMAFVVIGGGKKDLKVLVHNGTVTGFEDYAKKPISRKGIAWDVSDGGRYVLTLENLSVTALPQIELISRPADAKKNTTLDTAELRVEEGRK